MRVAGVDGCKGGWVAMTIEPGGDAHAERLARLDELFDRPDAPDLIAVDMPIGLPEMSGPQGRAPERLVRAKLGPRRSSVFSIPSRAAIYASADESIPAPERYRHVCAIARATSVEQKAIARQAFHILPKIIEIDTLLHSRPELRNRIHECHPEVSFWAMNGEVPLAFPKKASPGLTFRRALLEQAGFAPDVISALRARALHVGQDDLIDACAAAWTAGRIARNEAVSFPTPPERDAHGLPICIWA